ncbi:MAG TPA: SGNH/GDSL hydrolase family protein [Ktedonobacterales bacterium]
MAAFLLAGCQLGGSSTAAPGSTPSGNAATPTQRPAYIYVAIGASETFGQGADRPATQNYPILLGAHLVKGAQVINLGIPGETAPEAVRDELPEALDVKPNLVTVWLGVNDIAQGESLGDYQQGLDNILAQLATDGHPRIAVANIPDLNYVPRFYGSPVLGEVLQWNKIIAQEVKAHGDILVDMYSASSELLGHPEYISGDQLHPSTQGYRQIANFFYQVLKANGVI